ncbi:HAD family hydrolase [Baekduia soli]|uniref:HAD family hydrolase n=1 Tax=Baekduia soli TaxID=496014 RepID=A0A5B8UAF1_9ACTN|nr:HAD family hydrolase [Baekduia soli]QEC50007.1 HAD family hydrolase [Baekduia soli]
MSPSRRQPAAAILDIDGTLVDTNYHHAVAWFRAFRQHGHVVPLWRIHRHIGMGGDQMVGSLLSDEVERAEGDAIREAEKALYLVFIAEVEPLRGARALLEDLRDRGRKIVLASSAKAQEVDHYLDLLDARELATGWTTSADVQRTKPAPDLVLAAMELLDGAPAVMVGDSTWDCEAAKRAGLESIAVLTGGFSEGELRDAGASAVFGSIDELRLALDDTPFG